MSNPNRPPRDKKYISGNDADEGALLSAFAKIEAEKKRKQEELATELAAFERVVAADKKEEEQAKIDSVIADIDAQNTGAPQYGKAWSKDAREALSSMQEEMDALGKAPEEIEVPILHHRVDPQLGSIETVDLGPVRAEPSLGDGNADMEIQNDPTLGDEALTEHEPETRLEWHQKLKGLIMAKTKEGAATVKERVAWWANSEEHLIRRVKELDTEAEKIGGTEKLFRNIGEFYNKRNWKTKLLIGGVLGVGAGVSMAASLPLALTACVGGLATQRILGLASMYLKFEKDAVAKDAKWGKEKAMVKALLYTAGMSYAIKEGVEAIGENEMLRNWLAEKLGYASEVVVPVETVSIETAPTVPVADISAPPVEVPVAEIQGVSVAESPVESLAAPLVEAVIIPEISIEAEAGKGYEWMLKRLAEQLPDDFVVSPDLQGTDIEKLFEAKQSGTLDAAVHKLAAAHGAFIEADGTSKLVNLGDVITLGEDGNIELNGGEIATTLEGRGVTPQWPPVQAEVFEAPIVENAPAPEITPSLPIEPSPVVIETPVENSEAPESVEEILQPSVPGELRESIAVNKYGVDIAYHESHLYTDKGDEHVMVFGGSAQSRDEVIRKFLTENPNSIVYGSSDDGLSRIGFTMTDSGEIVPSLVYKEGFFSRFFGSQSIMPAVDPSEFRKMVQ